MSAADPDFLIQLQLAQTDKNVWSQILAEQRQRLRNMIDTRMDLQVRGRVDASDIIQEACLEATQRLPEYLANPGVPFYIWLRSLTAQRLALVHRHHLGTKARDARREDHEVRRPTPGETSVVMLAALMGQCSSPSSVAVRQEEKQILEAALTELEPIDHEILVLRHFEELTNSEVAAALGIKPSAAASRYLRAPERLRTALAKWSGGL